MLQQLPQPVSAAAAAVDSSWRQPSKLLLHSLNKMFLENM